MATIDIVREEEVEGTSWRYVEAGRYADFEDYLLPSDPDIAWSEPQALPFARGGRAAPPFVYDVLTDECDRIRLLRIFPQKNNDSYNNPPECELITFDLHSAPPYMALSYSWGSPNCPKHISYINNHIREDTWENLYNFMCHFRQDPFNQRPKYIWIDQLCINMNSNIDRSYNVKLMSKIYREAVDVVSWLGMDRSTVRAASYVEEHRPSSYHLATLLDNQYFTRLWIVQEILLARKVYFLCGNTWVALVDLERSVRYHGTSAMLRSRAYYLLWDSLRNMERRNLAKLILRYRDQNCGQPHDRVYALRGLVARDEQMEVDYRKPIATVLIDTIKILVRSPYAVGNPRAEEYFIKVSMVLAKLMRISPPIQHELRAVMEKVDLSTSDASYARISEELQTSIDYEKMQQERCR